LRVNTTASINVGRGKGIFYVTQKNKLRNQRRVFNCQGNEVLESVLMGLQWQTVFFVSR